MDEQWNPGPGPDSPFESAPLLAARFEVQAFHSPHFLRCQRDELLLPRTARESAIPLAQKPVQQLDDPRWQVDDVLYRSIAALTGKTTPGGSSPPFTARVT